MNAISIPSSTPFILPASSPLLRKFGPLVAIIALHIAFFYALQSGLLRQSVVKTAPKEIIASFITLEPAPAPKPEPKTVPVVKKTVTPPKPRPVITPKPSPQAITEPAPPPAPQPPAEAAPPAAAAPPAPAQPATPKIVSGLVYKNTPFPPYPRADRQMGIEGTVILRVVVDEKGFPIKVEINKSSGSARIDESARDTVLRHWSFKPYIEDGRPAQAAALVPINFTLSN